VPVYQPIKFDQLRAQLAKAIGTPRIWPLLQSDDSSLNNQPAASALPSRLGTLKHIVLEGPPGSGKTVLSLFLGTSERSPDFVYLEAQRWAPSTTGELFDDFLLTAGCDHKAAIAAKEQRKLVLILDAVDEAPWRTGGASALDVLPDLCQEIYGKVGLLITARTSKPLPPISTSHATAVLGGIAEDDVPAFLAAYAGSRTGVGEVAATLKQIALPVEIKYSPLVLRRFAEGLLGKDVPTNLIELFERIADAHIERECAKPSTGGTIIAPGSWQEGYSDPGKHRSLVAALVYSAGRTGRVFPESQLTSLVKDVLRPASLSARAVVDLSTLMAQHPLVTVAYVSNPGAEDTYHVQVAHDWVRSALFPKFLSEACFDAWTQTADVWYTALPHEDDFALAWGYLGSRVGDVLQNLQYLTQNVEQSQEVAAWLLAQLFNPATDSKAKLSLWSAIASLAWSFVPIDGNVVQAVGFEDHSQYSPELVGLVVALEPREANFNLAGVLLDDVSLEFRAGGADQILLERCSLRNVRFTLTPQARIRLRRCVIESVNLEGGDASSVIVEGGYYDSSRCVFPQGTDLSRTEAVAMAAQLYRHWALAEVLKKFIVIVDPRRPELARKKTNIAEGNVYHGMVRQLRVAAEAVVERLINDGYMDRKPTGGVRRLDPTDKFDAVDATRLVLEPASDHHHGPMVAAILGKL
jgi:hypothetical protein